MAKIGILVAYNSSAWFEICNQAIKKNYEKYKNTSWSCGIVLILECIG